MAAIKRRFPREVVELHSRLKEVSELIEDDWRPAFRRNYSAAFQARLSLVMERDRIAQRIKDILNRPPPPPSAWDRAINLLLLLLFGACVLVGGVITTLLVVGVLAWLFSIHWFMAVLGLMLMWMALK